MKIKFSLIAVLFSFQLIMSQSILGIDVSHYQGTINWTQVAASGKVFCWAKASEGKTYQDPNFTTYMNGGMSAGIVMGAYHFARPDNNTALEDATNFLNTASAYIGPGFLPPVLDLENTSTTNLIAAYSSAQLTAWAQTWLSTVENATGVTPVIYINSTYANYLNSSLNVYPLWLALWSGGTSAPSAAQMGNWNDWLFKQYTETGTVSGISGNVDLDVFNGTAADFNTLIYSSGTLDCSNAISLTCGVSYHGAASTAASNISTYGCNNWSETGPERVHTINVVSPGTLTASLSNFTGDLDVYILNACHPDSCIGTVSSSSSTATVQPGTYYIVVDADDGSGSAYDLVVDCPTPPICQNPTNVTASNITTVSATLSWTATSPGCSINGYDGELYQGSTASGTAITSWSDLSATSYSVSNLQPNTTYTFKVRQDCACYGATASAYVSYTFTTLPCSYSISPTTNTVGSNNAIISFAINASAGCPWSASTSCGWISLLNSSGTGSGNVTFNVAANTSASLRSCTITVNGLTYSITQQGVNCSYSLFPIGGSYVSSSVMDSFMVNVPSGCAWTAVPTCSWVSIVNGSGNGSGKVKFTLAGNLSPNQRSCEISVNGQYYAITQEGITCAYSINPTFGNFDSDGGNGNFILTTQDSCPWSASSTCAWVSLQNTSGVGTTNLSFDVAENTTTANRTCSVEINGQSFAVFQSGVTCSYSLNETQQNINAAGGALTVNVTTSIPCAWTASSTCSWVQVQNTSGMGSGSISYTVEENTSTTARNCFVNVSGQLVEIVQAGLTCIPPVADFYAGQTQGEAPLSIDFYDNTSNAPTAWAWSFYGANNAQSTLQNPSGILYNTQGLYSVKLIVSNACGSDSLVKDNYIEILQSTALSDLEKEWELEIFPNPFQKHLTIKIKDDVGGIEFSIFNNLGQLIFTKLLNDNINKIDLNDLESGIYFVKLRNESGEIFRQIVKE